jgi:hypothetical protein
MTNIAIRAGSTYAVPTDYFPAEQIQDDRQVQPYLQRADIGDAAHPDLIRSAQLQVFNSCTVLVAGRYPSIGESFTFTLPIVRKSSLRI